MLDAVVISDVHLGGLCTRTDDLLAFLQRLPETKRLIVNGDLLDALAVAIPDKEMLVLDRLDELNRDYQTDVPIIHQGDKNIINRITARRCEVTWIRGNHDPHPEKWAALLGLADVDVKDEVVVESGGKKFLITHGHQWDPWVNTHGWFHGFGAWCSRWVARWVSVAAGRWLRYMTSKRSANDVMLGGAGRAQELKCDGAICGHTHQPLQENNAEGINRYTNEGSWCENAPPTWAEIKDGEVRLKTWEPGKGKVLK